MMTPSSIPPLSHSHVDAGRSTESRLERLPRWVRLAGALVLVYLFLTGIGLMGAGFKALGKGFAAKLLTITANPLLGLFVGVLATSLVQSSSLTTSVVVGLVSGGSMSVQGAIPMIMGANIGTTVTNTIVSLGFVGDDEQFERAFAVSTVHDFFNYLCVLLLLPLELIGQALLGAGPLELVATKLTGMLTGAAGSLAFQSPVKVAVKPAVKALMGLVEAMGPAEVAAPASILLGLLGVGFTLWALTQVLRSLFLSKVEGTVSQGLVAHPAVAVLIGVVVTAAVQSSSVTTSLLVPLAAAGLISVQQAFPVTIGANIGTTVTALLASLGGTSAGLSIALVHLGFNIAGALIFLPFPVMRRIPVRMAEWLVELTRRSRLYGVAYVVSLFFGLPALMMAVR